MSFDYLDKAIPLNEAMAPILPGDVDFDSAWTDEVALGIVLADVNAAIAYESSKNFVASLEATDDLIRGYVKVRNWPNTDKARSALSMPIVLEAVEKILPFLHLALFGSGKDPFLVSALGRTNKDAAKAWQTLLRWAVKVSDYKEGSRLTMKTCLTYGFAAGIHGWESQTVTKKQYRMKPDGSGEVERDPDAGTTVIAKPTYECANLRNLIFDSACYSQDARKGKFICKRITLTAHDLKLMMDDTTYKNVPSEEELREILANKQEITKDSMQALKPNTNREFQAQQDKLATSKDPLAQPLEYLEYETCDRIVGVLQRCIVIRNEPNGNDALSVVSCAFIDVLNSLFGFGIGRLLNSEQKLSQGILNYWVDSLALLLNPTFQQLKGLGGGGQNISISPGKVISTEGELKALVVPDVSATAQNAIEASAQRAYRRVGANGGSDMPNQAMRTGTGVQAFQGDITQRLQYFLEQYVDLCFVPVLEAFLAHCSENLTPAQIQQILTDEDGKAFEGDILSIYNASVKVEILAGVKLTTRQAAAQAAPLIMQMLMAQAVQDSLNVQAIKFDYTHFAEEYLELLGWDIDKLFVTMTAEDQKRAAQQNPQAIRNQGIQQQQQQQHANDLDLIDAKGAAQSEIAVVRAHLKVAEQEGLNSLTPNSEGQ